MACGICRATLREVCRQHRRADLCELYEDAVRGRMSEGEALDLALRIVGQEGIRQAVRALVEEAAREAS